MSRKLLPTVDSDPHGVVGSAERGPDEPGTAFLSRRGFVTAATWSLVTGALLTGCGGGGDATGPGGGAPGGAPGGTPGGGTAGGSTGITISGNVIAISIAQVPELAGVDGFRLVREARTVVINVGNDQFRAFTSICPHQQCDVSGFAGGQLICPCHDSRFNRSGQVVQGPATAPLMEYATSYNASTRTLTVTRA